MKRLFDILLSSLALIASSPILLLAIIGVRLTSRGPVFYNAKRIGKDCKLFHMYKFRTMVVGADKHGAITTTSDRRVTTVGRILRATKVDELPQLINILKGEMTIVGPRPEDPSFVHHYYNDLDLKLLSMPPGLTCTGQLYNYLYQANEPIPEGMTADVFYAENQLPRKLSCDMHYVKNQNLWYDIKLIFQTVIAMLRVLFGTPFPFKIPYDTEYDFSPRKYRE